MYRNQFVALQIEISRACTENRWDYQRTIDKNQIRIPNMRRKGHCFLGMYPGYTADNQCHLCPLDNLNTVHWRFSNLLSE